MKVLAIIPSVIPSTIIYTIKPLTTLHQQGKIRARIRTEFLVTWKDLAWAEIVLFIRNYESNLSWILDYLNEESIPYIYDLDDNFFAVPQEMSFGQYLSHPDRQLMIRRFLSGASMVRVYSKPLVKICSEFNSKVQLVNGPFDWSLVKPKEQKNSGERVKIVYATSRTTDDNLGQVFLKAVERILDNYDDQVELHLWGSNPLSNHQDTRVIFHKFIRDYDRYIRAFSAEHYDIGLAPLINDIFHRSKTNIKYREYSACHIAGIYSNVDVYTDHIQTGINGLIVDNTVEAWYGAIENLIQDPDLRINLANAAYKDVKARYSTSQFNAELFEHIHETIMQPKKNYSKPFKSEDFVDNLSINSVENGILAKILHKLRLATRSGQWKIIFQVSMNYLKGLVNIIMIQTRITISPLFRNKHAE